MDKPIKVSNNSLPFTEVSDARLAKAVEYYSSTAKESSASARVGRVTSGLEEDRQVWADIARLLRIRPGMKVLDIGCGCGFTANQWVAQVTEHGIEACLMDIPAVINEIRNRFSEAITPHLRLAAGTFPADAKAVCMGGTGYDAILAYSLFHYNDSPAQFLEAAVQLLAPGGRLLIGDIPNLSRKGRFLASASGRAFDAAYRKVPLEQTPRFDSPKAFVDAAIASGSAPITDEVLCDFVCKYRDLGFDAFLLEQPESLPFCHSREDLLICRPEN